MASCGASFIRPTPKLTKLGLRNSEEETGRAKLGQAKQLAGSLALQQSAKSSATLHGGPWTQPVERKTAPARRSEDAARTVVRNTEL